MFSPRMALLALFFVTLSLLSSLASSLGTDMRDANDARQHVLQHVRHTEDGQPQELPLGSPSDDLYVLFHLHDHNRDSKLDGNELLLMYGDGHGGEKRKSLEELDLLVEHTLDEDDRDGDGMISWAEYLQSLLYHQKKG